MNGFALVEWLTMSRSVQYNVTLMSNVVPGDFENNAYVKCWAANKVHYGRYGSGEWEIPVTVVKWRF